jgi:hypothetical protein
MQWCLSEKLPDIPGRDAEWSPHVNDEAHQLSCLALVLAPEARQASWRALAKGVGQPFVRSAKTSWHSAALHAPLHQLGCSLDGVYSSACVPTDQEIFKP